MAAQAESPIFIRWHPLHGKAYRSFPVLTQRNIQVSAFNTLSAVSGTQAGSFPIGYGRVLFVPFSLLHGWTVGWKAAFVRRNSRAFHHLCSGQWTVSFHKVWSYILKHSGTGSAQLVLHWHIRHRLLHRHNPLILSAFMSLSLIFIVQIYPALHRESLRYVVYIIHKTQAGMQTGFLRPVRSHNVWSVQASAESSNTYVSSTAFTLAVLLHPLSDNSDTDKQIQKFTQSIVSSLHRLFHAKQAVPLAGQLKVWAIRIPVGYGRCRGALPQTLQAEDRETDFHTTALTFPQIIFQIIQLPVKSCAAFQEERYLQLPQCRCPTARYRVTSLHSRTQENPATGNPPWRIIKSGFIFLESSGFQKCHAKSVIQWQSEKHGASPVLIRYLFCICLVHCLWKQTFFAEVDSSYFPLLFSTVAVVHGKS